MVDLMQLKDGGAKFRDRVKNRRVFKVYMLVKEPVLGVTGAHLDVVQADRIEMLVPDSRATRNLFGDFFASAATAAAETTSAAMCVLHIRNQAASLRAELAELTVRRERRAVGTQRIVVEDGHAYAEFVRRAAAEGEGEETFHLVALDEAGHTTFVFSITWRLFGK